MPAPPVPPVNVCYLLQEDPELAEALEPSMRARWTASSSTSSRWGPLSDLVAARRPTVTNALSDLSRRGEVRSVPEGWLLSGEPPSSARPGANPRLA